MRRAYGCDKHLLLNSGEGVLVRWMCDANTSVLFSAASLLPAPFDVFLTALELERK